MIIGRERERIEWLLTNMFRNEFHFESILSERFPDRFSRHLIREVR